jgi:hypothetical protein
MPLQQQQAASKVWDTKLPPVWRQDFIDKGTTAPEQLDPALKGVSAREFPVTLVVVSKRRGFAVYRREKATKDGGVTHPVCMMYERAIKHPFDLFWRATSYRITYSEPNRTEAHSP